MPLLGKSQKSRLSAAFLIAAGAVFLLVGGWVAYVNIDFMRHSSRAPGTVVEVVGERGVKGGTLYHPIVRYQPRSDGAGVTFKAEPGMWPSPFDVGDAVTVAYKEHDPSDANIVSFWTLWMLPLTLFLFGAGCLVAGRHTLNKTV